MGTFIKPAASRIPLGLKLAYTAFVAVLVPVYWKDYGPVNFLYFCDVALLVTVAAVWLESPFLASTQAIGITLPQLVWQVDFITYGLARVHWPYDFTEYMFDSRNSLFLRGLSFFHFWLPILLVWLVWRLGYDRRALLGQMGLCVLVLLLSYLFTPKIDGPAGNVNKVFGLNDATPQASMPRLQWVGLLMAVWCFGIYVPTHFLFCLIFRRRAVVPRTS